VVPEGVHPLRGYPVPAPSYDGSLASSTVAPGGAAVPLHAAAAWHPHPSQNRSPVSFESSMRAARRALRWGLLRPAGLGGVLLLAACVRVAVEARAPEPSPTRIGEVTLWTFAWGLARTPKVIADCGDMHVHRATVHTTLPGFLLGLVTLGIVLPSQVEYVCAARGAVIHGQPPP
jgi:hypothetical protein